MEYRFKAEEWAQLSPTERARRCKLMAEEARLLADNAPLPMKEGYLMLAKNWLQLASEIEASTQPKASP
jgi:hypothetical protein